MATIEITTTTEIPDQVLADIIITAVEGGTGYWAEVLEYVWETSDPNGVYATLIEEDDDDPDRESMTLTTTHVARGLELLSSVQPWRFARLTDEDNDWDHDAEDADVIVQLALLGRITYG